MKKILVLAEKPSVGRDIARVLNCNKDKNGYIEGSKYIVTWALGHLVTLADPESYGEKYKSWKMEDLPILPPKLKTFDLNCFFLKNLIDSFRCIFIQISGYVRI